MHQEGLVAFLSMRSLAVVLGFVAVGMVVVLSLRAAEVDRPLHEQVEHQVAIECDLDPDSLHAVFSRNFGADKVFVVTSTDPERPGEVEVYWPMLAPRCP